MPNNFKRRQLSRQTTAVPSGPNAVLMLSAGMLRPKKAGNAFASLHRYLNYGLLGLATRLRQKGFAPRVFHGHFDDPTATVERLAENGWLSLKSPVMLSLPSSYALAWARVACLSIKAIAPWSKIVVGGRWVTADDGDWIRQQLPDVDLVVFGLADNSIHELLRPRSWRTSNGNDRSLIRNSPQSSELSLLDYSLLDRIDEFTPSFEVSRGCGKGCGFCAEAKVALSAAKPSATLADEIVASLGHFSYPVRRAFFEASLFQPSTAWIGELTEELVRREINLQWRTETRVDHMSSRQIAALAKAGMKVLDLGLESASPTQLNRMGKTTKPDVYLRKASELLTTCKEHGVWAKVNVLLYPGETDSALTETRDWLINHASCIKGVSAGPMILYRYGSRTRDSIAHCERHGGRLVSSDQLDKEGFADLHLSEEIQHDKSIEAARDISQLMMLDRDYYDLKAFSYFPPSTSFDDFRTIAQGCRPESLPFRMTPSETSHRPPTPMAAAHSALSQVINTTRDYSHETSAA